MKFFSVESNYKLPSTNEIDDFNGLNQKLNVIDLREIFPSQYGISLDGLTIGVMVLPVLNVILGNITLG